MYCHGGDLTFCHCSICAEKSTHTLTLIPPSHHLMAQIFITFKSLLKELTTSFQVVLYFPMHGFSDKIYV